MKTELWAISLVILDSMIGTLGPIYFKKGSGLINLKNLKTVYANKNLIIGVLIYGISMVIFIPALKGGDLSVLYPLVGLSYVWVCLAAKIFLKEKMNIIKWSGILLIVLGVAFIGMGL